MEGGTFIAANCRKRPPTIPVNTRRVRVAFVLAILTARTSDEKRVPVKFRPPMVAAFVTDERVPAISPTPVQIRSDLLLFGLPGKFVVNQPEIRKQQNGRPRAEMS